MDPRRARWKIKEIPLRQSREGLGLEEGLIPAPDPES
jgi:hypothetical protein